MKQHTASKQRPASLSELGVKARDPWGNAYVLESEGEQMSVRSFGPDGKANTGDDLVSRVDVP